MTAPENGGSVVRTETDDIRSNPAHSTFINEALREMVYLMVLYGLTVFGVYFLPEVMKPQFFLAVLIISFLSKKNQVWLAYLLVILEPPLYLFSNQALESPDALPIYKISAGLSFAYYDLLMIVLLYKFVILVKQKYRVQLTGSFKLMIVYIVVVTIPISFLFNTTLNKIVGYGRPFVYYIFILVFSHLIKDKKTFAKFGYALFPLLVLSLIDQIYYIITAGDHLFTLIGITYASSSNFELLTIGEEGIRSLFTGTPIILFMLIFSIMIFNDKEVRFIPPSLILSITLLAIFLSATRSLIAMSVFVAVGYILWSGRITKVLPRFIGFGTIAMVILLNFGFINTENLQAILFERFLPAYDALAAGELQSFDTAADRFNNDLPKLMQGVENSPLIGVGFSLIYAEHNSDDLGFPNAILAFGYAGFTLVLFILFRTLFRYKKVHDALPDGSDKNAMKGIVLFLAMTLIGYSTTYDFFTLLQARIYLVAIILSYGELVYRDYLLSEQNSVSKA